MHASPAFRRAAAGVALATTIALVLTACSGSGGSGAEAPGAVAAGDGLQVVATTTQLTDFTRQVGGDDIALTGLLTAGASAHHFDPSPADLLALGSAEVLVVNGVGLEEFLDDAIEAAGFDGVVIDASEGVDLEETEEATHEADDGHDDDHDHDHAHDHGAINPHIWTSPEYAADMVDEVAQGLAEADPDHAADYQDRAGAYVTQLDDLDKWIEAQFERVPSEDRVLVSGHDSLRYYLDEYDIEFAGAILPSFEDNSEPSAADIDQLVSAIKERGVTAVFVESSMSPKLASTIAKEAGVEVVTEDALYADSLGAEGSGAETYIDATIHNTQTIIEAWGGTVDPLPNTLGS
ncbi:MAG: metal ABC transporter substrate-binding protein [Leucobacter sp.]